MTTDQSQSNNKAPPVVDRTKNQPGVLCVKCDHLNYLDQERCERCGAALYVVCPRCKNRNMRVYTRCQYCRKRLHGSRFFSFRRRHRRSALHEVSWVVLQVILVLLGIAAVLGIVYLISQL